MKYQNTSTNSKPEEKIVHEPCKKHKLVACTICKPVPMVTSEDDKYFIYYNTYHSRYGHESSRNHKDMKEILDTYKIPDDVQSKGDLEVILELMRP